MPFTPVDELGCWLDGPGEPNNVHLEVHVAGHLDPARLGEAVGDTLTAHPLARARRAPHRGRQRRLEWEVPDRPGATLERARWSTPEELARGQRHLLAAAPPLDTAPVRVQHAVGPDRDVVLLSAHHAVLDGLSCLRLLRSIARRYAGAPDPVPANPLSLRVPRSGRDRPPRVSRRPPTRIAADRGRPLPGYGLLRLVLPCRPRTGPSPGTVNDVLIVALAVAIASWNSAHGADARNLRITVPINARPPGLDGEQLGNLCRLASIAVPPGNSPRRTLADVITQTSWAKNHSGPQLGLVTRVLAAPCYPVAVRARLVRLAHRFGARRFSDTSLVSNLGKVGEMLEFGPSAPVAGLWFSTPAPMPRGLSLGVLSLRDELHLCFRYRLSLFDDAAATRFAGLFRESLAVIGDPRFEGPLIGNHPQGRDHRGA